MKKEEYYIDANRIINAIKNPKITYLHVSKEYALVEKDYLDELLKNNNDWIKCSDRLPSEYEYVLAWIESRYRPEYKSVTITHFYDGEFEIQAACHFNVLYWRQLPLPPTE